ncbi:nucleotide exchange factor GrpE [Paracoccus limosus]|uniref:Protein GrpE n=1 Tax=Paracoccus limosus TaxID=913252 RepID=A0A844H9U9_9RHOB|nr:nucleotide exchange factor GrpE [Paracoccus limosus]MTH35427.1 nucleotide exchange factor GrpE [Paracoccus limosus]
MTKDNPNGNPLDEDLVDPLAEGADAPSEIEALIAERDSFRDRFMRALADAENARKRADRERREAEQYGGSRLARDLLPVHEALTRALETANDEQRAAAAALIEGVELTLRELNNVFAKHGIHVITPQVGDKFDPQQHEAMFEAPLPGTVAGHIIQVMGNGFMLHDRLLRPAKVGVSSNPAN